MNLQPVVKHSIPVSSEAKDLVETGKAQLAEVLTVSIGERNGDSHVSHGYFERLAVNLFCLLLYCLVWSLPRWNNILIHFRVCLVRPTLYFLKHSQFFSRYITDYFCSAML